MIEPTARRARLPVLVLLIATGVALTAGFWLKYRCTTHVWRDGYQYRSSCYNDIYALYFYRGLQDGRFPYLDGDGSGEDETDGDLEYPVGTGLYLGGIAKIVRTPPAPGENPGAKTAQDAQEFFEANAIGLALAGVAAVLLVAAMVSDGRRALIFALAPSVVLYAFHNWDLLAVALMCGGLYAFRRRADRTSGMLLGLGAATKLFPGLVIPALVLARWRERRDPWPLIGSSMIAFAAINLPILIANPQGWFYPWRFQSTRPPNFETSWWALCDWFGGCEGTSLGWADTYPQLTGWASALLFVLGAALLLRAEARRKRTAPYALSFGLLLIFLLTAKVFSPQYALWVLPFFALLRIPWKAFVAFAVSEAAVWVAISGWFIAQDGFGGDPALRFWIVEATVMIRYAVLVWLLVLSRRVPENVAPAAEPREAPLQLPA